MATVVFTHNLERHVDCPTVTTDAATVRDALEAAFVKSPRVRGYVLDEQGALRKHMVVFVDGRQIQDRATLSDPVGQDSEVYVMQALSGG
jgi:hypothetical protein